MQYQGSDVILDLKLIILYKAEKRSLKIRDVNYEFNGMFSQRVTDIFLLSTQC